MGIWSVPDAEGEWFNFLSKYHPERLFLVAGKGRSGGGNRQAGERNQGLLVELKNNYPGQSPEELGGVQDTIQNYLAYFLDSDIAEVFCSVDSSFDIGQIDQRSEAKATIVLATQVYTSILGTLEPKHAKVFFVNMADD